MTEPTTEELETEAAAEAEAAESSAPRENQPKTLGLARWVQMTFMAFGLLLLWVLDKAIAIGWDKFAEPKPELVTLVAAIVATTVTMLLYRNATVSRAAHEVVGELARVSWPSRKETQVSTVVVIITSIIAAAIVGAFDAAWSAITDLIYKV
jgi:preprotein translocase SecE subunit